MSLLRALSGDTYRTRTPVLLLPSLLWGEESGVRGLSRHRPSRQARNAASVLPEPVGARMRVLRPAAMAGQPSRCAGVGSPRAARNHSRTDGRNKDRGSGSLGEAATLSV